MLSLPEIATQRVEKLLSQTDEKNATSLILVGNKNVGKSSLMNSLLEKADTPRATLVLEYAFGRKTNQKHGIEKNICHVWEYGGKLEELPTVLPLIPIKGSFHVCVVVDLSKIKRIWETLEICIGALNEGYSSSVRPEIIIIGGKYDIFKNYDNEIKKFICVTIRSVALLHNAHVLFYSSKEPPLAKRTKDILHNIGFGYEVIFKEKNTNFMKPLIIIKGSDSWESIGIPPSTLQQVKSRHLSKIPPEAVIADSSNDNYTKQAFQAHPEPSLDKLAALKYEELRNMESLDISISDYLLSLNK